LPATDDVAPWPWRDHLVALGALRRGRSHPVLSVDAADGVRAGRILFSLREPLGAIDRFERAIVECDDPSAVETGRLSCLVILDRLAATGQPRASR